MFAWYDVLSLCPHGLEWPRSPVSDLAIQPTWGDLAVATQGRSFWILDDLSLLRQMDAPALSAPLHLFRPRDAYRSGWQSRPGHYSRDHVFGAMLPIDQKGTNAPEGAVLYYHLAESFPAHTAP